MIRKLRFKLISAAMISLFIVITIIIGIVNILNYHGIVRFFRTITAGFLNRTHRRILPNNPLKLQRPFFRRMALAVNPIQ